jgi:hypothetical protein
MNSKYASISTTLNEWTGWDLNPRPCTCEAHILPLNYQPCNGVWIRLYLYQVVTYVYVLSAKSPKTILTGMANSFVEDQLETIAGIHA